MRPTLALATLALVACSDPAEPPAAAPVAVALIAPDSVTVLEQDSTRIDAYLIDSAGQRLADAPIVWVSRDTGIATVAGGVVRFRQPGQTVVAALSEGFSAQIVVSAALRFVSFSAGANFSGFARWCGITDRGSLWCLPGEGGFTYPNGDSLLFFGVPGGSPVRQVSVGPDHFCALTAADEAFCWGANDYGQLGDDTLKWRPDVYYHWNATRVSGGHRFSTISVGSDQTCAVTVNGAAYCWGRGLLGSGTGYKSFQATPLLVAGGLSFTAIASGSEHACGITVDSVAVCWGGNGGRLGIGATTPATTDTPAVVNSIVRFTSIAVGDDQTCGLGSDSIAYCWGANQYNQVGSGPDSCGGAYGGCALSPTAVPGAPRFRALQTTGVAYVADETSCGITRTDDLYCWGSNQWGQIGNGTQGASAIPVSAAASGLKIVSLDLGSQFSCGAIASGTVYCWGLHYGAVPVRLPFQP